MTVDALGLDEYALQPAALHLLDASAHVAEPGEADLHAPPSAHRVRQKGGPMPRGSMNEAFNRVMGRMSPRNAEDSRHDSIGGEDEPAPRERRMSVDSRFPPTRSQWHERLELSFNASLTTGAPARDEPPRPSSGQATTAAMDSSHGSSDAIGWRRRAAAEHLHPPLPTLEKHMTPPLPPRSRSGRHPHLDTAPLPAVMPDIPPQERSLVHARTLSHTASIAQSPINPGANSIFKHWPPDVPAPGYTPTPANRPSVAPLFPPRNMTEVRPHTSWFPLTLPNTAPGEDGDNPRVPMVKSYSWRSRSNSRTSAGADEAEGDALEDDNQRGMEERSPSSGLPRPEVLSLLTPRGAPGPYENLPPVPEAGPSLLVPDRPVNGGEPMASPDSEGSESWNGPSGNLREHGSITPPEISIPSPTLVGRTRSIGNGQNNGGRPPPRRPEEGERSRASHAAVALGLVCTLLVLWGLRESDRVSHLKAELTVAKEKQRNLTQYLRSQASGLHLLEHQVGSLQARRSNAAAQPPQAHHSKAAAVPPQASEEQRARTCAAGWEGSDGLCTSATDSARLALELAEEVEAVLEQHDADGDDNDPPGTIHSDHVQLRRLAFFVLFWLLLIPILLTYYLDDLPSISPSWLWGAYYKTGQDGVPSPGGDVALSKRLAYKVDVWFSTYSWVKSAALLVATLVLIAYGGLALYAVGGDEGLPMVDATWRAWTYVADAGNHADSTGLGPRIVSVCISFGGMLIFALMVGLVTETISEKVDSLRKGKSDVIEQNHTLILGWSDKLGSLINQLALANESAGGGVIVIMAERDKEDMECEILKMEIKMRGSSVICRTGSALVPADLKKVNVSTARAVVVLAEEDNADAADAHALRVVLSLCGMREGLRGHIVAELSDIDSNELVKMVGGNNVETVVAHDVIGRLMIQCARQPGLAQIWETLLGFENCEFYSKAWPELEGRTFRDALLSFPEAVPIGLKVQGYMILNPNDDYILQPGDEVLVIAEDDDSYAPAPPAVIQDVPLPQVLMPPKLPEKILFCGWRRDIDDMIVVLEAFLARGSELWIFSDVPIEEREERLMEGGLNPGELENMTLVHRLGNAVIRRHLETLPMETFDSILILADERHEDSIINCDSRSLATLLLIRDIQSKRIGQDDHGQRLPTICPTPGGYPRQNAERFQPPSTSSWVRQMQEASQKSIVISEILDSRTRSLVSVSQISDYVLSNELVSMALAMVAEDRAINQVLSELFAEEGNEMYIRPAELYVHDGEEACFFDLMARARKRKEIMIGYRAQGKDDMAVINPPDKTQEIKWRLTDSFIVLSFEE